MNLTQAYEWPRAHPRAVDLWLAGGLLFVLAAPVVVLATVNVVDGDLTNVWSAVLSAAQLVPLLWRRTRPAASFAAVTLACALQVVVIDHPLPSNVGYLVASYSVAAYSRSLPTRLAGLAVAPVAGVLAVVDWDVSASGAAFAIAVAFLGGLGAVSWVAGDLMRNRRTVLDRLEEQNRALRRDRDQRVELAAQHERARIAREMHDVVAHSLSVVVVQADGGAYAAEHAPAYDRDHARQTLATIADAARAALRETRGLVAVLREDDGAEYSPAASLADLEELVAGVRGAGHEVAVDVRADLAGLPRDVQLAAYRIVQESLTNVLKHAGPGARSSVAVTGGGTQDLVVEVHDDGRGASAPDDGEGNGVIGMRERALALGGALQAGPRPGGGFAVRAVLPSGVTGGR